MEDDIVLIPQPRMITRLEGWHDGAMSVNLIIAPAAVPQEQGYRLKIEPQRVTVTAHDEAGAFYAKMTLKQLARTPPQPLPARGEGRGVGLPCLEITDWPDFPARGVMLDISRDKVPTMETLLGLIDLFASLKINQLQLYTEHTFAYSKHKQVWENASPLTAEEIQTLDEYCRERFIELVPNQNSFGHMERWLKFPAYKHLAETPDGAHDPWGNFRAALCLCPGEPWALELLDELYAELLPNFKSQLFNVGCDETWDLGQGRSKDACAQRGVGRVYLEFLLKIYALTQKHGKRMQFWGDIIMHHPELIAELPRDIIAMEWGYEANHPFAQDGSKFAAAGIPFYVCPGTSSWNSIAGRTDNALANLRSAAENGLAHGASGYLNTDWGDNGHWQPLPVSYLPFAYGAAVSWCAETAKFQVSSSKFQVNSGVRLHDVSTPANLELGTWNLELFLRALDLHVFHDDAGVMGQAAFDLGNAGTQTGVAMSNSSSLHWLLRAPETPTAKLREHGLTIENLERTRASINAIMQRISNSRMPEAEGALIRREFVYAGVLLLHACELGLARLRSNVESIEALPAADRRVLAEQLRQAKGLHRSAWLARNRAGGLSDSAARLEAIYARYRG